MKFFRIVIILFFSLSCKGEKAEDFHLALWSEFLPPREVMKQIPFLQRNGLALYQAINYNMLGNDDMKELLASATDAGIETRAWLLLDYQDGYWPDEDNVDKFYDMTVAFMDWVTAENIPVKWIVVDMEMSWQKTRMLANANGDFAKILELLESNINIEKFNSSKQKYIELVDTAHSRGFKVMCVTYPQVLDDIADGDATIQDALDIPVTGIDWDEVSFMVYRTTFNALWSEGFTSYLVYSYAKDAIEYSGEKAGIDVGLVAPPVPGDGGDIPGLTSGYTTPDGLLEDIGAARSAGIKSVHIWPLDYVILYPEPDKWVDTSNLNLTPPEPDEVTDKIRELFYT